jgi:putative transposase
MARIASVVIPGLRYHVAQRGNGGRKVFFSASDYAPYGDRLSEAAREAGVAVWT